MKSGSGYCISNIPIKFYQDKTNYTLYSGPHTCKPHITEKMHKNLIGRKSEAVLELGTYLVILFIF